MYNHFHVPVCLLQIVDGFAYIVQCSLDYLLENSEPIQKAALRELQFLLQVKFYAIDTCAMCVYEPVEFQQVLLSAAA